MTAARESASRLKTIPRRRNYRSHPPGAISSSKDAISCLPLAGARVRWRHAEGLPSSIHKAERAGQSPHRVNAFSPRLVRMDMYQEMPALLACQQELHAA